MLEHSLLFGEYYPSVQTTRFIDGIEYAVASALMSKKRGLSLTYLGKVVLNGVSDEESSRKLSLPLTG